MLSRKPTISTFDTPINGWIKVQYISDEFTSSLDILYDEMKPKQETKESVPVQIGGLTSINFDFMDIAAMNAVHSRDLSFYPKGIPVSHKFETRLMVKKTEQNGMRLYLINKNGFFEADITSFPGIFEEISKIVQKAQLLESFYAQCKNSHLTPVDWGHLPKKILVSFKDQIQRVPLQVKLPDEILSVVTTLLKNIQIQFHNYACDFHEIKSKSRINKVGLGAQKTI